MKRPLTPLMLIALGFAFGCTGKPKNGDDTGGLDFEGDDAGECTDGADNDRDGLFDCDDDDCAASPDCANVDTADSETDTHDTGDTDIDSDTETGDTDSGDTDSDSGDSGGRANASLFGTVVAYDGAIAVGIEVQACETTCFTTETDGSGAFGFTGMEAGDYKVDVVGEAAAGKDYGRMRVQAVVGDSDTWTAPGALFMPQMVGPVSITSSGSYAFGDATWTVDPATLTIPFGYDADDFSVGVVQGYDIAAFWSVTPALAVAFGPFGTTVSGAFDLSVSTSLSAGTYTVYSVNGSGALEGPVGTASANGVTLTADGVSPTLLTWLFFVPA